MDQKNSHGKCELKSNRQLGFIIVIKKRKREKKNVKNGHWPRKWSRVKAISNMNNMNIVVHSGTYLI